MPQQIGKGFLGINPRPQHERINEEPNQLFQLRFLAIGYRRADHNVLLPAVTLQQYRKSRKQRHVKRGIVRAAERF